MELTANEKCLLVNEYGTEVLYDYVVDTQEFKHDLIFVWNEESTHLDEIKIINIDDKLMIDPNKKYRVVIQEITDITED